LLLLAKPLNARQEFLFGQVFEKKEPAAGFVRPGYNERARAAPRLQLRFALATAFR